MALVTGGSGSIGRAICARLADEEVLVAVGYRADQASAEALVERIVAQGGRALAARAGVREPDQLRELVDLVRGELGEIDILISNAGGASVREMSMVDLELWDATMDEHARAAFLLSQMVLPQMRARGWGRLLFVSSAAAQLGGFVGPHYASAKAALIGLMHSIAGREAGLGITANVIAPALIESAALGPPDQRSRLLGQTRMGRFGQPEEVAELALAMVANAYLSNQSIFIDGALGAGH